MRQFAKDHPTIVNDPIARSVADQFLTQETEGKPLEAFTEEKIDKILAATGERFLEWTRALSGASASGEATTRDEKVQRKEKIDELPAASTRAQTQVPQPRTTSQIIEDMKASRGQLRNPQP